MTAVASAQGRTEGMAGNYYFVMVAPGDRPVFEAEFGPHAQPSAGSDKVQRKRKRKIKKRKKGKQRK